MDEKRSVTKAAGQISIATTGSRVLGLIRDILLAKIFGATGSTDAFFVAFRIPNLFRELFAEGSMSAAFIPVFTESLTKEGSAEAKKLASSVFAFLLSVLSLLCVVGIIFAPAIVTVIAPGFLKDQEKFSLTVTLTRFMFPFLFFVSLAAFAKGILNSLRSFLVPALAPMFLNISIIFSALFLSPRFEVPLIAIALAVTAGGALQVIIQIPDLIKKKFLVPPLLLFSHPGLKKILRLLLPAVVGMGVQQINILIATVFVSYLSGGSVTYLYYSMRFVHLPIGIFGVAMATAVLPSLSEQATKGDSEAMKETFSFSLRLLFFITLPAMAGLISLSEPIIHVFLLRGEFTPLAVSETAYALICYTSGLWAFVGYRVVVSVFYSFQDTKTPVKIAVLSILANIIFCLVLIKPMRHGGLALANALAQTMNFLVLFYLLRDRLGRIDGRNILRSFIKVSIASMIMGLIGWHTIKGDIWIESGRTLEKAAILSGVIALCAGIYFSIMYMMKSEELEYLIKMRKRKG
jgi:putative peptidoglycan lipid II flippase